MQAVFFRLALRRFAVDAESDVAREGRNRDIEAPLAYAHVYTANRLSKTGVPELDGEDCAIPFGNVERKAVALVHRRPGGIGPNVGGAAHVHPPVGAIAREG